MVTKRMESLFERGHPAVMGIINVTPDSFFDGGRYLDSGAAVARGRQLAEQGADILDVGGESTRPGATPLSVEEELDRVVGVVEALAGASPACLVSIDTRRPEVAEAALSVGARVVNDVSAAADPGMLEVVADRGAALILMHMRGEPGTMQDDTRYQDVVAEVHSFLLRRADAAIAAGVAPELILLDPGIGFGKDLEGNLRLLAALPELAALGFGVVVGASRKSFIGRLTDAPVAARLPGSLAALAGLAALPRAVARVHDVAETVQFLKVRSALEGRPWSA